MLDALNASECRFAHALEVWKRAEAAGLKEQIFFTALEIHDFTKKIMISRQSEATLFISTVCVYILKMN